MSTDRKRLDVVDLTSRDVPAGDFSAWLHRTRTAAPAQGTADVPCGECTACCASSYFVHIAPDETETLRRIPPDLTIPAPGYPQGSVLLGYDSSGRCSMLVDQRCSIYEYRPRTCRSYDCRIFVAAGIDSVNRERIDRQIRSWRFSYASAKDRDDHAAVQAAARFIREHADQFPRGAAPAGAKQLAALAIQAFDVLADPPGAPRSDFERVEALVAKIRELEEAEIRSRS
jgi:uncharacterized protein